MSSCLLRSLSVTAALALAGVPAAQQPTRGQPILLLGDEAATARSLPGVIGTLEVETLVAQPYVRGLPIVEQIRDVQRRLPQLAGKAVHVQILYRDPRGVSQLSPVVAIAPPRAVPAAQAQALDESGAPGTLAAERPSMPVATDPELYPPIPTPVVDEDQPRVTDGRAVTYDVATGREIVSDATARNLLAKAHDFVKGSGGVVTGQSELDLMVENYNKLTKVLGYTAFPWRINCKLLITWPNNKTGSCSGAMIDPRHVLTAGHCIYSKADGGWAKRVVVVPAYNGEKPSGAGREPYGTSTSVQLHSWTGWTQNGNFSHDIGVIDVGRPVGALTGWFGYGYNTSCSWFTSPTWHHASYPGEALGGRRMYYQYGDFDSCPGLIPPFNTYEAHWNGMAYKGESGSAHYKIKSGSRIAYAATSHRHSTKSSGPSGATRLTSSKFGHVGGWLLQDRPTKFDFTPLDVNGSSSVARGKRIAALDFLAHNYSRVSYKGKLTFEVRLSTNKIISTADRLLGTYFSTVSVGSLGSARIKWTAGQGPLVPKTVAAGTYYVGIILKTPDASSGNQTTLSDDVHKISVFTGHVHGVFTKSGLGCQGTAGKRPNHYGSGHPDIAQTIFLRTNNARANTFGELQFAAQAQAVSLAAIGMPGCWWYVKRVAGVSYKTNSFGLASYTLKLPNDTSLVGKSFYTQAVLYDPGAPHSFKFVTSNRLTTKIGGPDL